MNVAVSNLAARRVDTARLRVRRNERVRPSEFLFPGAVFLVLLLLLLSAGGAGADGPNAVVPFVQCSTTTLPRNDDGSTGAVPLPFPVNFFGTRYDQLWVNNNGNVTFDGPLSEYVPFDLTTTDVPIIAVMLTDIDTRGARSQQVTYGNISVGETEIAGHQAFCVNWVNVGEYSGQDANLNSAQLLLVDRSDTGSGNFEIWMNYDKITWDHGGIGVGYSDGTGNPAAFFQLPGSGEAGAYLDTNAATGLIHNNNNSPLQPGRYIYPVLNGALIGHSISGHVWQNEVGTPVSGAFLQACAVGTSICRNASSRSDGAYIFNNLPDHTTGDVDHSWNIVVNPPNGSELGSGTIGPVTQSGADVVNQDVVLHGPRGLPEGASLTTPTRGTVTSGIPTVYWTDPLTLSVGGPCTSGTGSATLTLSDGYSQEISLPQTAPGSGVFAGTFAATLPHHGAGTITYVVCDQTQTFDLYIDPSGVVTTPQDEPVAGATVTLLRADDPHGVDISRFRS